MFCRGSRSHKVTVTQVILSQAQMLQDLTFVFLGMNLTLVWSFLAVYLFLPFGIVMLILWHCILELSNLLFVFIRTLNRLS